MKLDFCLSALLALNGVAAGADSTLTIYNQNFAVVRETLPVELQAGRTTLRFSEATAQVEPDSVILRDVSGKHAFQILEQNYRNDGLSQERLLSLFEGKTIEFLVKNADGSTRIVQGRILRSGYTPHYEAMSRYGQPLNPPQPIIEVEGKLRFSLPGEPLFPALGNDTILKPELDWILLSQEAARFEAELSYISGGMSWSADYNVVAPETGDTVELTGWVTLDNQSGKDFERARIKLMAGDVNKVVEPQFRRFAFVSGSINGGVAQPQVSQQTFEDYHLYALPEATTLHDRETKQVEFLRAAGIQSRRLYVYDGMTPDTRWGIGADVRQVQQYGTESNPNVWIMREFTNTDQNHLGVPLPAGRLRFYRRDQDGQLEFTGENEIRHTPKDETVRVYTGNAFDISGERRQTHYQNNMGNPGFADEAFEIQLRNHKKEAVTVKVVEHLSRWSNWVITQESQAHKQTDSKTIEYEVKLEPDQEKVIAYTAHYTW